MKHLRFLVLAALVAMPLMACDDDKGGTTVVPVTGTISGSVTAEGAGVAGVSVTLVGATSQSATTDAGGAYTFAGVEAGSYGIAISDFPADVSFSTVSKTTSITTTGQVATVDFSGSYIRTASISGNVSADGAGIAAVAVTLTGPEGAKNAVTDAAGNYSASGLRGGDYTVSIAVPAGYIFANSSFDVSVGVGEAQNVSFVGEAEVTVDPVTANVVIKSVTNSITGATINPNNVFGQIDITVQVDPGQNDLQRVCVLLDGAEVANGCQTLGSAVAEGEMMQGGVLEILFTIFTNDFAADGSVVYPNNTYELSAVLDLENAQQSNVQTTMSLTFANADMFMGVATPDATAIGDNGFLYYGGEIAVVVTPVVFSGETVSSVTITYYSNGGIWSTLTDGSAPFEFVFEAGSGDPLQNYQSPVVSNDRIWVTNGQYAGGTTASGFPFTVTGGTNITVDNVDPQAVLFELTDQVLDADWPICCSNNWVNPNYPFADALSTFPDNVNGVGGVVRTFHMGEATLSQSAIAALPAVATPGETGAGPSDVNTFFEPVAVLTDALGNQRTIGLTALGSNPLNTTVGHDAAAPTNASVSGDADMSIWNLAGGPAPAGMSFSAQEDRAGFSAEPVRFTLHRLAASSSNTEFLVGADSDDGGFINTAAFIPACGAADATNAAPCIPNLNNNAFPFYFTATGHMMDQAGNEVATDEVVRGLVDLVAPVNQNINIPGSLVGGAQTTFTVPTADFDLATGTFGFAFPGPAGPYLPFGDQIQLGDGMAWDGMLSPTATATLTFPFVRGLEAVDGADAPGGVIVQPGWIQFIATDVAGNQSSAQQNNFAAGTVPTPVSFTGGATATFAVTNTADNLCNGQGAAACATGDLQTLPITVEATGPSGTYPNVFAGGTLYFHYTIDGGTTFQLLGTVSGTSGLISDTGAVRTYEWTFTITSADVETVAAGAPFQLYVIGVNSTGDALLTNANGNITIVDGS